MIFPEVINYLLTLRYPGSESDRQNWVCYRSGYQVIIPVVPPGATIAYTVQPLHGVYAWLGWSTRFGTDMVPNVFTGTIRQYGTIPVNGVLSQRMRDDAIEYFILVTEQEPTHITVSNISPLGQRLEVLGDMIVIPTPKDLATITDALRRLHTSARSEQLQQEAAYSLSVLSGQPLEPRPPIGGEQ